MQVYHLFGWFWVMNFIIALGQCVLAGAFASYYWAWDKKNVSDHHDDGGVDDDDSDDSDDDDGGDNDGDDWL